MSDQPTGVTQDDIEGFAAFVLAGAEKLLARDGHVIPVVLMARGDTVGVRDVSNFFGTATGKDVFAAYMRFAALSGADMLGLVTEAWSLHDPSGTSERIASGRNIAHAPGRRECIQVTVQAKTGWTLKQRFFGRDAAGKPVLEELVTHGSLDTDGATWGGRLMNWYRTD